MYLYILEVCIVQSILKFHNFNFPSFLDDLPDEVKGLEILNSLNGFGSNDPKLPATLTNQVCVIKWENQVSMIPI